MDEPSDEFYGQWTSSPFADEYLERMAEAAIDGLRLGQGTTTDYLGVSFSVARQRRAQVRTTQP